MTTRIKILIMMILFCFSCKNGVRTDEVIPVSDIEFKNRLNVSSREIKTDFLLSFPENITLTAGNFIILDSRGHDFYYHIIDRDSGTLVKDFGMKGQGPQDLLFVNWNPFYNQEKNEFQVFDGNGKRLCYYDLNENNMSCQQINEASDKYQIWIQELFDMGNCYLAAGKKGYLDTYRFVTFDKSFLLTAKLGHYPVVDSDKDKNRRLNDEIFSISLIKISPDKKKMVFASYKIGLLEIFDLSELPKNINLVKSMLLTKPEKNEGENIYGFEDVYVTDNYIYALHNGKTAEENPYLSKSIKVFDWSGNPVIEYDTGVDMRCLAVDENERKIYAVAFKENREFFLISIDMHNL